MDDVYVYLRDDLPAKVGEFIAPCPDGYTIYISAKLDDASRQEAYEHAIEHIRRGDFDIDCVKEVQEIEAEAHGIKMPASVFEKKLLNKKRRKSPKVRFLESVGYDFFSAAERNWLDPK